jgi:hypothetical protein
MSPTRNSPELYPAPDERVLKVYAFDPSRGRRFENHLSIRVPYESDLRPGPIGERVAVIDYDATNRCYYLPVDLDDPAILGRGGLDPSESNPQFHQQMVYAVIMETIRRFDRSLGRQIRWAPCTSRQDMPECGKLLVFPHGIQMANAFYDPSRRSLFFGYFPSSPSCTSQPVFTCLSHDIIVHETTHAIIDGVRRCYKEHASPDSAAFHEGFADIVALLQHFSFKETLLDTIQRTGGLIHRSRLASDASAERSGPLIQAEVPESNPMVELAREFGYAMGNRKALRSALGTRPNPRDMETVTEPHARGAIFVAAIFDAFFSVYIRRTRDLFRIAYPDGRAVVPNYLHSDLANRLAEEAAKTAARVQNICIRSLDYCPPVDIQFGDFLRALVTADREVAPSDDMGYRAALIDSFCARGILPEGVASYSEESLSWPKFSGKGPEAENPNFLRIWDDLHALESHPDSRRERRLYQRLWMKATRFSEKIGLSGGYRTYVQSANLLHRVQPDGSLQRQVVVEVIQTREGVPIFPDEPDRGSFDFRGGATLLISRQGKVRYSIVKPIKGRKDEGSKRLERQRGYFQTMASSFSLAPYVHFDPRMHLSYCAIHRGY